VSVAQPITGIRPGEIPENIFLCGDPERVDQISASWTETQIVCRVREYRVISGKLEGLAVAAASTGIGAPSTAILVEELAKLGARRLIRIGNSGGLASGLNIGELVVTTGCVRDDGTSTSYVHPSYPAVADYRLVTALMDAGLNSGLPCHAGITWSLDAFYIRNSVLGPEGEMTSMSFQNYWNREHQTKVEAMQAARVINCEMEAGTLLTLGNLFGLQTACICVVSDLTPWPGPSAIDLDRNMGTCIEVAGRAMLSVSTLS